MAKRRINKNNGDMEIGTLKSEISTLNKRMEEVITILGGNSSYRVKGIVTEFSEVQKDIVEIRKDISAIKQLEFAETQSDIIKIKNDIAEIKQQEKERWMFHLKTIPQKIIGLIAFLALIISMIQGIRSLLTVAPTP